MDETFYVYVSKTRIIVIYYCLKLERKKKHITLVKKWKMNLDVESKKITN